jgi:hypothetical protein
MEEVFLDMSLPGFKAAEEGVKAQGYIEKRYTKSTQKEIEEAYKRQLLKQLVRTNMRPANINALKPQIEEMVKTTLYESGPGGAKVFKFKMFVPGKELRAQREAALMGVEEDAEEEIFAPENYGKYDSKAEKVEKAILEAYSNVRDISPSSNAKNIQKALDKSRSVHKMAVELLPELISVGNSSLVGRGQAALIKAQQLVARSEAVKAESERNDIELAELVSRIKLSNKPFRVSSGINKDFIEDIMEFNDENNENNENNENENYKNRNKFYSTAMSIGMTSGDLKFLRDILKIFTSRGMPKKDAVELGIVLGNLPRDELKGIVKEVKPVMGKSNDEIAQQLYGYLMSKRMGGRRRVTRRRVIKKRATRRR